MSDALSTAIAELKHEDAIAMMTARIARGEDVLAILAACRDGMTLVSDRFQQGDNPLSELLLAAEIFKQAAATLEPYLALARASEPAGLGGAAISKWCDIQQLGNRVSRMKLS